MEKPTWSYMRRAGSLLLYGHNKMNYKASCQIQHKSDERAVIHTTNGPGFYLILAQLNLEPFRKLGIRIVEANVKLSHLRLLQEAMKGIATVTDVGPELVRGRCLRRIEIEDLKPRAAPEGEMSHEDSG